MVYFGWCSFWCIHLHLLLHSQNWVLACLVKIGTNINTALWFLMIHENVNNCLPSRQDPKKKVPVNTQNCLYDYAQKSDKHK